MISNKRVAIPFAISVAGIAFYAEYETEFLFGSGEIECVRHEYMTHCVEGNGVVGDFISQIESLPHLIIDQ